MTKEELFKLGIKCAANAVTGRALGTDIIYIILRQYVETVEKLAIEKGIEIKDNNP
jgi:hypothetical protein